MRIGDLVGNPNLDREEMRLEAWDDVRLSSGALPDSPELDRHIGREMAEAFGWDVEESPEEVEAHYRSWMDGQQSA